MRSRRFWPLFWTQFLGAFNDNLFKNALVMLIAFNDRHIAGLGPALMVPVAGGIFVLPYFLFSASSGQLADRSDKAAMIQWTKILEIGIMALAAAGFMLDQLGILLVVLFFMGLQSTVFGPCKYSILPQHLTEEELVAGNALVEMATYLAILGGTITGGVLVASPNGTNVVAVLVVLVAIAGAVLSRLIPDAPPEDTTVQVSWNPVAPTRQVIGIARRERSVWLSILGISWFWLFGAAFLNLFPTWTRDVLHGTEALATLFLALFSIGIGAGSLICERLSRERLELGLVPIGSFGMCVFTADLWWIGEPWVASGEPVSLGAFLVTFTGWRIAVDLVLIAVFGGFLTVPLYTLIQQRAEPSERSRIIAANNIVNAGFIVAFSLIMAGLAAAGWTAPQIFALLALLNGLVAVYIYSLVPEFLLRFVVYVLSRISYRVGEAGLHHIPREGPVLIVCNHVSFIDWFILAGAIRRPARFVMDKQFYRMPVIHWLFRQAKAIPIASKKRDPECFEQAFQTISDELQDGQVVVIFPEGQLTPDGQMVPFKSGVEWILEKDPVPVVPMALNGLWGSYFSRITGRAFTRPFRRVWSRVWVTAGAVVPPEQSSAALLQERVEALWAQRASEAP